MIVICLAALVAVALAQTPQKPTLSEVRANWLLCSCCWRNAVLFVGRASNAIFLVFFFVVCCPPRLSRARLRGIKGFRLGCGRARTKRGASLAARTAPGGVGARA